MPINVMVYLVYKANEQRIRQQYIFAARGDITHLRIREMRWEGLIMISKETTIVF
jgi:hypothetical protein